MGSAVQGLCSARARGRAEPPIFVVGTQTGQAIYSSGGTQSVMPGRTSPEGQRDIAAPRKGSQATDMGLERPSGLLSRMAPSVKRQELPVIIMQASNHCMLAN